MPDIVPLHFNSRGEVNGTGAKSNLLLLPSLGIVSYVLFSLAPKFPQLLNYPFELTDENVGKHFNNALLLIRVLKCLIAVGALYLTYATIEISIGKANDLGAWFFPIAVAGILVTIAGFLYRGYRIR